MASSVVYEKKNTNRNCSCIGYLFEEQYIVRHFPEETKKKLIDYQGTLELVEGSSTAANTEFDKNAIDLALDVVKINSRRQT